MLEDDKVESGTDVQAGEEQAAAAPVVKKTTRRAPARKTAKKAAPAAPAPDEEPTLDVTVEAAPEAAPKKKAAARRTTKKAAAPPEVVAEGLPEAEVPAAGEAQGEPAAEEAPAAPARKRRAPAKKTTARKTAAAEPEAPAPEPSAEAAPAEAEQEAAEETAAEPGVGVVLFQAPKAAKAPARRTRKAAPKAAAAPVADEGEDETEVEAEVAPEAAEPAEVEETEASAEDTEGAEGEESEDGEGSPARRRRRRGGRRRRKSGDSGGEAGAENDEAAEESAAGEESTETGEEGEPSGEATSRRRRRRRRAGEEGAEEGADEPHTVTRVRKGRSAEDQITAVAGSTRLEAKKQRRREGREAGRRRAPIVSEAEFLARRESVDRVMVVRQRQDLTQIAVLEDKVLVEHYVARESQTSLIGNVYLGRVQNVLPSMEAAFIDIGKGRNAVLYAGEVNWSALGHKEGQPRKIEAVLQSGQYVLVQVTKDPVGHKGARLTSQISLAGRFLVYVPDGTTSGISRKLPDTERTRLKTLLKEIVPDSAGVIVRTAAEGASEEELTRDVERLKARWEDIEKKAANKGSGPQLLYGEPDLTLKVVRDLFTEDFSKLVIEGDDAWDTVQGYVAHVAPDLEDRLERFEPTAEGRNAGKDVFGTYRIEEQIQKGLDRKVWLPSGGSLIIDRTEAMTVVDVNTGKFTGSGGNLEETVTKNNLEAAEEIVRQLRLRDIGGIIVIDFIDMVLESNRDLVVRRLVECLGRDRTRHQVAEVTSLGLVQMTRKRIGTGLLEAFSETCEHCHGRGLVIAEAPVEPGKGDEEGRRGSRRGRGRGRGGNGGEAAAPSAPSPKEIAAMHPKAEGEQATEDLPEPAVAEPATEQPVVEAPGAPVAAPAAEVVATPVAESPAVDRPEPAVEPQPAVESAVTPEPGVASVEPPAEPPVEPAKPQVVTRTRRRAASRPAGPPVGVAGSQPATGAVEPGTADLEPGLPPAAPDGDAAPRAGTEEPHVEHVPIKKKGSRKR